MRAEKPAQGVLVGYDNRFGVGALRPRRRRNHRHDRHAGVARRRALPFARAFPAGAAARRGGRHHDHRQPQSLSLERNQVQGQLRQFGAAFDRRADRSRSWPPCWPAAFRRLPPRADLIHSLDILAPYLDTLEKLVDWEKLRAAGLRFVVDPMHGAARGLLAALMRRHGVACDEIRGTRDPLFGGVNPEPIEPHVAALREAVRAGGYDAGFAADGDGDRIGAMDSRRHVHHAAPDLFHPVLASRRNAQDCPATWPRLFPPPSCSIRSPRAIGRRVHEVPVGFKYICELMLERDILLGGEESGGIGTKLYLPERDATVVRAAAGRSHGLAPQVARRTGRPSARRIRRASLRPRGPGAAPRTKRARHRIFLGCRSLTRILDWPVVRREDLDGIKVYLGEIGWVMVRASGTEQMLRIYSETTRPETTAAHPE